MLLILPLQSFASAAMLGCALPGRAGTAHPAPIALPDQVARPTHAALQSPVAHPIHAAHPTPEAHQAHHAANPPVCHDGAPAPQDAGHQECTHCTACYLASALLVPASTLVAVAPVDAHLGSMSESLLTGFIPDGPDRPPRPLIA